VSSEALLRFVLVAVLVAAALGVGRVWRRSAAARHRPVDVAGLGLPPGVLLFTSTGCTNCSEARWRVEQLGVAVREVTWELEPAMFERAGVESVPLVVFADGAGRTVAQVVGIPSRAALRSGLAALGA
jgi:hypothetical protein